MRSPSNLQIRIATTGDAEAITRLSAQLGYPVSEADIRDRLEQFEDETKGLVIVAENNGMVVGWLEVQQRNSIESGSWPEIVGLVVDVSRRRLGAGSALVEAACTWAAKRGYAKLRVRTNIKRDDAAAFYRSVGFEETKRQRIFDILLR